MSKLSFGCCAGMACGCLIVLGGLTVAGVAIYYWLNPEAREERVIELEEKWWNPFKKDVDTTIEKVKNSDAPDLEEFREKLKESVPEPEL